MRGLLATFVLVLALALAGCGEKDDRPVLKIGFLGIEESSLKDRIADMQSAAEMAVENTGADTKDHRLQLTTQPGRDSIAQIVAPTPPEAAIVDFEDDSLLVRIDPAPTRPATGTISLLPSTAMGIGARRQYIASGLPRSRRVALDRPDIPGTPSSTYVTPALSADAYPPAGQRFFRQFVDEQGHAPDRYAIFAYEAVSLIVDAIQQVEESGRQVSPERVEQQALAIRDRFGPIGHYDVLADGSITQYIFQARGEPSPPPEAALIETRR
jgi:hypothetical protein